MCYQCDISPVFVPVRPNNTCCRHLLIPRRKRELGVTMLAGFYSALLLSVSEERIVVICTLERRSQRASGELGGGSRLEGAGGWSPQGYGSL